MGILPRLYVTSIIIVIILNINVPFLMTGTIIDYQPEKVSEATKKEMFRIGPYHHFRYLYDKTLQFKKNNKWYTIERKYPEIVRRTENHG